MTNTTKLLKNGTPTAHFRDNLRPEYNYVTGWYGGGFTNQFMGLIDLIMVSILTPFHIPVIPPFISRPHLPLKSGYRSVGDVFDLERWARAVNKEMVEWRDVKDLRSLKRPKDDVDFPADEEDELGCWSIWAVGQLKDKDYFRGSAHTKHLNLDISYTPAPRDVRLWPTGNDGDTHVTFNGVADLTGRTSAKGFSHSLTDTFPSPRHQKKSQPDTHLVCYDFLYWFASSKPFEWEKNWSVAWNVVGKHGRWSNEVRSLVRESLALTLGIPEAEVMEPGPSDADWVESVHGVKYPRHDLNALDKRDELKAQYISIHARHGDFLNNCEERKKQGKPCSPPLSTFARHVQEVTQELKRRGKVSETVSTLPVVITSDETDEAWWSEVEQIGWKRIKFPSKMQLPPGFKLIPGKEDYDVEEETYGHLWDRMLVEVAIQSLGIGFVGTEGSTMSLMAQRRVEHWYGGATSIVKFAVWADWD
ncbi:hypothetical protein CPB86DRAFT_778167 [Serendipita vermifera]|nr:hypothetical protein CPB86DRAFT_778167 [Serendipita vermifera]